MYACACNTQQAYTIRTTAYACVQEAVLNQDDDLALVDAISNVMAIRSLNATVVALTATVSQQQAQINSLISMLRTAANTATTAPQPPFTGTPQVSRRAGTANLVMSGSVVEVQSSTCSNSDMCDAVSFAATLKTQLSGL
jgi:hypothetical protein